MAIEAFGESVGEQAELKDGQEALDLGLEPLDRSAVLVHRRWGKVFTQNVYSYRPVKIMISSEKGLALSLKYRIFIQQ